ncbi:hypothetical protein RIF29_07504 [Crotalaria pallida]|uniref:AUGMIN subunit 8 n=1 Tax=Crotalaria pallida TaxID=3830 RepID=A0AAN9J706_CROPI
MCGTSSSGLCPRFARIRVMSLSLLREWLFFSGQFAGYARLLIRIVNETFIITFSFPYFINFFPFFHVPSLSFKITIAGGNLRRTPLFLRPRSPPCSLFNSRFSLLYFFKISWKKEEQSLILLIRCSIDALRVSIKQKETMSGTKQKGISSQALLKNLSAYFGRRKEVIKHLLLNDLLQRKGSSFWIICAVHLFHFLIAKADKSGLSFYENFYQCGLIGIVWMDVYESEQALRKHRAVETTRLPLVSAEKNNAIPTRRSTTREVSSRYKSPSPATTSGPRRCPSPSLTRPATPTTSKLLPKRPHSAERKRPETPPSPPRPSTPVHDSSVDVHLSSRKVAGKNLPEGLWPTTMRSLSVSFQSDAVSVPVSKKEKPVTSASDRTLRANSNVAHKQVETSNARKPTPERKRSPLKGKNSSDQSENSKPADGLHSRLIDQHRWPSRIGGRASSNALNRSGVDHADKTIRMLNTSYSGTGVPSLRRLSLSDEASRPLSASSQRRFSLPGEASRPLQGSSLSRLSLPGEASKHLRKASSDAARLSMIVESGRIGTEVKSVNDSSKVLRTHKSVPATPSDKTGSAIAGVRSLSLSSTGSRLPSPSKTSVLSSSSLRVASPAQSRPSTPPSRGVSPSRIRPTSSSGQSSNPISVLSFIADVKKGKKGAAYIEDAHQLRLLYNRHLQWRFANARAEDALYIQNAIVERTLYNVWNTTLSIWESIIRKRINLQQLRLELKLNSILNDQMAYLDDWAVCESDHVNALSGAVEDLEANTLRLPVTGGAKVDIEDLKVAICSAVDIMQAMGSAICPFLPRVESMDNLISDVAVVSAQEKAMLDECEALLTSAAAMQVEENSLRTQLVQMKRALEVNK